MPPTTASFPAINVISTTTTTSFNPTIKSPSSLSFPIILTKPVPKALRTKNPIRRIGSWVRSPTSASPPSFPSSLTLPIGTGKNKMIVEGDAQQTNKLSIITEGAKNGANVESKTEAEENALPGFLKLSKSDRQMRFTDLEWQARQRLLEGAKAVEQIEDGSEDDSPWIRLRSDEITSRNRYMNVDPYASNRVKLHVPEGQCDYINASPIKVATSNGKEKKFIATQGPKEYTVPHFWQMVLESSGPSPTVIVMLTQTYETNREKCYQYFPASLDSPTISTSDPYDPSFSATVTLTSAHMDEAAKTMVREIDVTSTDGRSKKVYHLLYEAWPDFLVPEGSDRDALLNLITLSRKLSSSSDSERIVHCSAGVGRTGTFIALDWLLDEINAGTLDLQNLKDDEEDDPIVDLVDRLRQQRMMMVQGDMQFGFLYEVVRGKWLDRWKKLDGNEGQK